MNILPNCPPLLRLHLITPKLDAWIWMGEISTRLTQVSGRPELEAKNDHFNTWVINSYWHLMKKDYGNCWWKNCNVWPAALTRGGGALDERQLRHQKTQGGQANFSKNKPNAINQKLYKENLGPTYLSNQCKGLCRLAPATARAAGDVRCELGPESSGKNNGFWTCRLL